MFFHVKHNLTTHNKQNKQNKEVIFKGNKKNGKNHRHKRKEIKIANRTVYNSGKAPLNKIQIDKKTSLNISATFKNKNNLNSEISNIKPDTDYELNWLSYKEAIKFDKRENCEYYGSLIKSKQLFIFTFCSFNDYNSGIIKKFMFFLSFSLHYTTNTLFFTESTLHQIYEDEGKYNLKYQISHILYSAIISNLVLRIMLQTLVLTDKDVLEVKLQTTKIWLLI